MSTIRIQGLQSLNGEIKIQGSKNAVLPMMAASILHKGITTLKNVPLIQDMFSMKRILEYLGCKCRLEGSVLTIDAANLTLAGIPEEEVKKMRSSIMLLGALLGRCGEAQTFYPGGCSIGKRPIDLHLYALRCLGAEILELDEQIEARAEKLTGACISLKFPSVGATENAMLGAVLAEGNTKIYGAAKEPEIEELCLFLNAMGVKIDGIGTSELTVYGGQRLHDVTYEVCGDRIVAGTYLAAVMAAGGKLKLRNAPVRHMHCVLGLIKEMGADVEVCADGLLVRRENQLHAGSILTGPYPGFPTDLQSIVLAAMTVSKGTGKITEEIFEGRFETVKELKLLGADIVIEDATAVVTGHYPLKGTHVTARDLRGGAALVVAGLAAKGLTEISECYHIERGYEDICRDLTQAGARIEYRD